MQILKNYFRHLIKLNAKHKWVLCYKMRQVINETQTIHEEIPNLS